MDTETSWESSTWKSKIPFLHLTYLKKKKFPLTYYAIICEIYEYFLRNNTEKKHINFNLSSNLTFTNTNTN